MATVCFIFGFGQLWVQVEKVYLYIIMGKSTREEQPLLKARSILSQNYPTPQITGKRERQERVYGITTNRRRRSDFCNAKKKKNASVTCNC